jgi:hypothetical protein
MAKESCTPPTNFGQLQLPGTVQENEGCVQSNSSLERLTHVHSHLASVESPNIIDNVQSDSVALANHLKRAHSPHMWTRSPLASPRSSPRSPGAMPSPGILSPPKIGGDFALANSAVANGQMSCGGHKQVRLRSEDTVDNENVWRDQANLARVLLRAQAIKAGTSPLSSPSTSPVIGSRSICTHEMGLSSSAGQAGLVDSAMLDLDWELPTSQLPAKFIRRARAHFHHSVLH